MAERTQDVISFMHKFGSSPHSLTIQSGKRLKRKCLVARIQKSGLPSRGLRLFIAMLVVCSRPDLITLWLAQEDFFAGYSSYNNETKSWSWDICLPANYNEALTETEKHVKCLGSTMKGSQIPQSKNGPDEERTQEFFERNQLWNKCPRCEYWRKWPYVYWCRVKSRCLER